MMFQATHNLSSGFGTASWVQWCWPDGGSYLEQPAPLVSIFSLIRSVANKELAELAKRRGGHGRE